MLLPGCPSFSNTRVGNLATALSRTTPSFIFTRETNRPAPIPIAIFHSIFFQSRRYVTLRYDTIAISDYPVQLVQTASISYPKSRPRGYCHLLRSDSHTTTGATRVDLILQLLKLQVLSLQLAETGPLEAGFAAITGYSLAFLSRVVIVRLSAPRPMT